MGQPEKGQWGSWEGSTHEVSKGGRTTGGITAGLGGAEALDGGSLREDVAATGGVLRMEATLDKDNDPVWMVVSLKA